MIEILKLMKDRNVVPDHDTAKIVLETIVYSTDGVEFVDEVFFFFFVNIELFII